MIYLEEQETTPSDPTAGIDMSALISMMITMMMVVMMMKMMSQTMANSDQENKEKK